MVEIVDGKGSGRRAEVDSEFRLVTSAITETEDHRVSQFEAESFILSSGKNLDTLTIPIAATGPILLLQSLNPEKVMVIERIIFSADAPGLILKMRKNQTIGVLANNTPTVPENFNFASQKTANVNAQIWDEVGTAGITGLTNGSIMTTFVMASAPIELRVDGAPVLEQNDVIVIEIVNTTGAAIEASLAIRFYFEETN